MKTETKKNTRSVLLITLCALAAGVTTYLVNSVNKSEHKVNVVEQGTPYFTHTAALGSVAGQPIDLTEAAEKTVHGVVHIKSTINSRTQTIQQMPDIFEYFFGQSQQPRQRQIQTEPAVGYGSGVILSSEGYIVTNNHVIDKADNIEVTLNDSRIFQARIVGTDVNTDLALLKIDGDEFPWIPMGNSENLKVGEWVLAVGNPFNLTSTVTAGVVSAKARKIGIYGSESIESFIQTDAAINRGNSGGALVNTKGELIGINAALESPTGTYAGYGFAIPTTIVRKIVEDLKEFGTVQRALLGILGGNVSAMRQQEENKDKDYGTVEGVYISEVTDGGGALAAGLQVGDIIISVNDKKIKTMTELQETITQYRPGDKVSVSYLRNKKERSVEVILKNVQGNTDIVKDVDLDQLGVVFQPVSDRLKRELNIGYGLQVSALSNGKFSKAGIQRGYIILKINNEQIKNESDFEKVFQAAQKTPERVLFITGIYQSGRRANYAVDLSD
ncbi:MAG TPA: Do family serine endopeptidase [Bacteroidaceae bacterium]|nr:Do family serine endopeptidase [Bacteroidaceae bacterium]